MSYVFFFVSNICSEWKQNNEPATHNTPVVSKHKK